MSRLLRSDFINQIFTIFVILTLFLMTSSLVMGEDPLIVSQTNLNVEFGMIHQLEVTIGEPVKMYQELTITNQGNVTANTSLALSDYPDVIPEVYLDEYVSLAITSDGSVHSVQPFLPVILAPYQTKEYVLEYTFVPVYKNVTCKETTIKDYLPEDAVILPSTLPPETVIEKKCNVKIHHDGKIHYYNVQVSLEELEGEKINSIYYVEGDSYLKLKDGVISLAK